MANKALGICLLIIASGCTSVPQIEQLGYETRVARDYRAMQASPIVPAEPIQLPRKATTGEYMMLCAQQSLVEPSKLAKPEESGLWIKNVIQSIFSTLNPDLENAGSTLTTALLSTNADQNKGPAATIAMAVVGHLVGRTDRKRSIEICAKAMEICDLQSDPLGSPSIQAMCRLRVSTSINE